MKITVAGAGYVGLSLATLLAQNHEVTLLEIVPEKVDLINDKKSPIEDAEIKDFLAHKELNLTATADWKKSTFRQRLHHYCYPNQLRRSSQLFRHLERRRYY